MVAEVIEVQESQLARCMLAKLAKQESLFVGLIQATGLQVLKSFFKVCRQSVSLWPLLMYACISVSSEE